VLSSAVVENPHYIIQCTGVPTLSLVLRDNQQFTFEMLGGKGDGAFDNTTIANLGFTIELLLGGVYLVTKTPDIAKFFGAGKFTYNAVEIDVPPTEDFARKLHTSIGRFVAGDRVNIEPNRYDNEIVIELNAADTGDANDWSLRESAFIYYEASNTWYLLADAVNLDNVNHPNTYETEIHLFKCTDVESLINWTYIGVAIEKGGAGELGEFGVASCSGAAVWLDGRIYAPFSARNNGAPSFDGRTIGLAYSNANPETIPWNKLDDAIVTASGENDDPACLFIPGDSRLHVFNRSTGPYEIIHSSSLTPRDASSWATPNTAVSLFSAGTTAIELTGVYIVDGIIQLHGMEQGPGISSPSIQISDWVSADPDKEFLPANVGNRFFQQDQFTTPATLYAGGHLGLAVRKGVVRAQFNTRTHGGARFTIKGELTINNPRKRIPNPMGLFLARPGSTQSIPNSAATKVNFVDAGHIDTYGWFISSRYTPQIEGWYEVEALVNLLAAVSGKQAILEVRRNNSRFCHLQMAHTSSTSAIAVSGKSPPIAMNGTTDYLEIFIFHNFGVAATVSGDSTSSFFSGRLVGK